jgi:type II secretory pathway pseudopilin PulG
MQLTPTRGAGPAGFTLPELLIALGLGMTLLASVSAFGSFQLSETEAQLRQNRLEMNVRNVIDLFVREVRLAGANPTCAPGISAIADAKQQSLQIVSDLDGDGTVTGPGETVTYQYKFLSGRFERVGDNGTDALLDGLVLTGSRLRYFDLAGNEVTAGSTGLSGGQRDSVRRIRLEVVASAPSAIGGQAAHVALATDVEVRNRYFGNAIGCP